MKPPLLFNFETDNLNAWSTGLNLLATSLSLDVTSYVVFWEAASLIEATQENNGRNSVSLLSQLLSLFPEVFYVLENSHLNHQFLEQLTNVKQLHLSELKILMNKSNTILSF